MAQRKAARKFRLGRYGREAGKIVRREFLKIFRVLDLNRRVAAAEKIRLHVLRGGFRGETRDQGGTGGGEIADLDAVFRFEAFMKRADLLDRRAAIRRHDLLGLRRALWRQACIFEFLDERLCLFLRKTQSLIGLSGRIICVSRLIEPLDFFLGHMNPPDVRSWISDFSSACRQAAAGCYQSCVDTFARISLRRRNGRVHGGL